MWSTLPWLQRCEGVGHACHSHYLLQIMKDKQEWFWMRLRQRLTEIDRDRNGADGGCRVDLVVGLPITDNIGAPVTEMHVYYYVLCHFGHQACPTVSFTTAPTTEVSIHLFHPSI